MAETLVRSVKKALDALDCVMQSSVKGQGAGLSDIAGYLNEKLPTVRNILKTMEACDYLSRNGKLYLPGAKCRDLQRCGVRQQLADILDRLLQNAAIELGEAFVATTIFHGRREVLCRFQGSNEVSVNLGVAEYKTVYSLVTTRVMLAHASPAEVESFVRENGLPGTEWQEVANGSMEQELSTMRQAGFAMEKTKSFCAYAHALTGSSGILLGAIGVYAPAFRVDDAWEKKLRKTLADIALQVKKQL